MNTTERAQLSQFLQQLTQAQAGPKDEEAQRLIERAVSQQPDAAYLLVQRALLQDGALQVAQQRIAELERTASNRPGGGFLDANAWGRAPAQPMPQAPAPAQAPAAYAAASPQPPAYAAPAPSSASPSSGFQAPSFLTSMATTAAGVAAGAFLFQGIGHLMGGHQGSQGLGASAFGLGGPQAGNQPTEVINNYYDSMPADARLEPSGNFLDASSGNDGFDSVGLDLDANDDWTA